jgi:hypothetical protein
VIIKCSNDGGNNAFTKLFSSEKTDPYTDIELLEILDSYELNKKPIINSQVFGELIPFSQVSRKRLRNTLLLGIPDSMRAPVWKLICKIPHKRHYYNSGLYE